jgi:hypothetical protein
MTQERPTSNGVVRDPELAAAMAIEALEQRQDRTTLVLLAAVYEALAESCFLYADVLANAARLRESRQTYDRHLSCSNADDLVEQLAASGVAVYQPPDSAVAATVREGASVLRRFSREAREAMHSRARP